MMHFPTLASWWKKSTLSKHSLHDRRSALWSSATNQFQVSLHRRLFTAPKKQQLTSCKLVQRGGAPGVMGCSLFYVQNTTKTNPRKPPCGSFRTFCLPDDR